MTPDEEWRPVVGYEGMYEVSDQGRVRSLDRRLAHLGGVRLIRGTLRSTRPHPSGYLQIDLWRDGLRKTALVHALVAEAFIGSRPLEHQVCHYNGVGTDNRLANLRYDTVSANHLDVVRHGRHHQARKTHCDHGHEFTPENTSQRGPTNRQCKTCARRRAAEQTKRRRDDRSVSG